MIDPRFLRLALVGVLLLALSACRKDRPEQPDAGPVTLGGGPGVYITNEGNFQWGNASVSYYDITSGNVTEDLYAPANGMGLGDVCQSMVLHGGKAYVVVNNSGKVVVVDPDRFVASATITGFSAPRYFLPVGHGKAYVTDHYANSIAVVDLGSNSISGSIPCAGATQELVLVQGKVFITNESRGEVHVVDPGTDAVLDTIVVSRGANSLVEDANGKLWVACSGGAGTPPALVRIDPQALAVEGTFAYPGPADGPWRLTINGGGDTLYFLRGGIHRMAITDTEVPATAFIPADGRNLYALGVDPVDGTIYVSDAIDYVQRGLIHRYRPNGTPHGTFHAGIIPSSFCFR